MSEDSGGLERNMMAAHDGIEEIAKAHQKHVFLAFEDPVTFGAGHYVFSPLEGDSPRLVITEQYADTDWSDDERVPTSWSWESEARTSGATSGYPWTTIAEGEVASADYQQLLDIAEGWASALCQLAEREAALTVDAASATQIGGAGHGRTFLT